MATWLEHRGWRLNFDQRWQHEKLSARNSLSAEQAVTAQTRHERLQAEGARATAIRRADLATDDEYREAALAAIHSVAERCAELTTDSVLAEDPNLENAREPRCLGPLMLQAAREGWIASTDRMAASNRRRSNARPKRVWRSLIVGGRAPAPEATAGMAVLEAVR